MDQSLEELLEAARNIQVSDEEREKQRRSFAYGNAHIENERITRQSIDRAADLISVPKNKSKCLTLKSAQTPRSTNWKARNAVLQFDRMRQLAAQSVASGSFSLTECIDLDLHEHATRDIYSDAGRLRDGAVPPPYGS